MHRCLQAAYTYGSHAKGIECDERRNSIAIKLADGLAELHAAQQHKGFKPGNVAFEQGKLQDPDFRDFLVEETDLVFCNNFGKFVLLSLVWVGAVAWSCAVIYNVGLTLQKSPFDTQNFYSVGGVFSGERDGANLDRFVAGLFALMKPGTVLVTLAPLRSTLSCLPLRDQNEYRVEAKLCESKDASFYKLDVLTLGKQRELVSWSEGKLLSFAFAGRWSFPPKVFHIHRSSLILNIISFNVFPADSSTASNDLKAFVYTRTYQSSDEAVFLCPNKKMREGQTKRSHQSC